MEKKTPKQNKQKRILELEGRASFQQLSKQDWYEARSGLSLGLWALTSALCVCVRVRVFQICVHPRESLKINASSFIHVSTFSGAEQHIHPHHFFPSSACSPLPHIPAPILQETERTSQSKPEGNESEWSAEVSGSFGCHFYSFWNNSSTSSIRCLNRFIFAGLSCVFIANVM